MSDIKTALDAISILREIGVTKVYLSNAQHLLTTLVNYYYVANSLPTDCIGTLAGVQFYLDYNYKLYDVPTDETLTLTADQYINKLELMLKSVLNHLDEAKPLPSGNKRSELVQFARKENEHV